MLFAPGTRAWSPCGTSNFSARKIATSKRGYPPRPISWKPLVRICIQISFLFPRPRMVIGNRFKGEPVARRRGNVQEHPTLNWMLQGVFQSRFSNVPSLSVTSQIEAPTYSSHKLLCQVDIFFCKWRKAYLKRITLSNNWDSKYRRKSFVETHDKPFICSFCLLIYCCARFKRDADVP